MVTTIDLISATDVLTLTPAPDPGLPWVYDNTTLDAWYALAEVDAPTSKRPNAHGAYSLGQVFTKEHRPILAGQYFGAGPFDALQARNRLVAFFADGKPVTMRVNDELGTTSRQVWLVDFDAPFRYGFADFHFDVVLVAPDPRRYGPEVSLSTGLPTVSGGLVWPLGTTPGLHWDWGVPGVIGQVAHTNTGGATTFPRITVGGGGSAFEVGFRVTEIETGRELTLMQPIAVGEVVTLDSRTQRATIAGLGDVTGSLASREWFEIPSGQTRTYQINPLGSVTGSPTMTLYAASAYL